MIRDEIIRKIREHEKEIQDLGAERLSLFGSAARGDLLPESDIDILVSFVMPADYRRYINLKFFLEDLLQRPVDLVMGSSSETRGSCHGNRIEAPDKETGGKRDDPGCVIRNFFWRISLNVLKRSPCTRRESQ